MHKDKHIIKQIYETNHSTLALYHVIITSKSILAQFDKYFHNKTLRMDYAHCGNSQHDEIYFEELLEEPYWGGSKTNLIDTMFYGNYYLNVYDVGLQPTHLFPGILHSFLGMANHR